MLTRVVGMVGCAVMLITSARTLSAQDSLIAPRAKGSAKAPVTVYEMSDFQCPYCKQFTDSTFPALQREYIATGKVRWVFINFPLTSIHANAQAAAEFASCAMKQGRFWPTHDFLYAQQPRWEKMPDAATWFMSNAAALNLNRDKLASCLQTGQGRAMVLSDAAGAQRAGAGSTPTFFIEGGLMKGAQPASVFRPILDSIIRVRAAGVATNKPAPRPNGDTATRGGALKKP